MYESTWSGGTGESGRVVVSAQDDYCPSVFISFYIMFGGEQWSGKAERSKK